MDIPSSGREIAAVCEIICMSAFSEKEGCGGNKEGECCGFGCGEGGLGDIGVGVGLAEVVEDVGEVGETDAGGTVEVAAGPGEGVLAEVVENGGEVGEGDVAIGVGITQEFGRNKERVGVDGKSAESGKGRGESGVVDDGYSIAGGKSGTGNASGVGLAVEDLVLQSGECG